jgi:RNA polymerase sigma factor (sigma-70 family)
LDNFYSIQEQFQPMINKIISSLHIYKDKHEFYQTGLIALWEASEHFNADKGEFAPFAYSYIRGRILSEMTNRNKHEEVQSYPKEEFWEAVKDERCEEPFPKELLLSYCEVLTDNQTKWVMYSCLNMLTIQEIADLENVSVSAVKKWRKGAKEKLMSMRRL